MMTSLDTLWRDISQYAQHFLQDHVSLKDTEIVPLTSVLGRVLAKDLTAPFAVPRHDISAMDGYAFRVKENNNDNSMSANTSLILVGESKAGQPFSGSVGSGEAIRIFTGAVVPFDCNTVEMQENVERLKSSDGNYTRPTIRLTQAVNVNANIRKQGEEVSRGETLLTMGTLIRPHHLPLLASLGFSELSVYTPLKVGLIASGDELVAVGDMMADDLPSQAIFNSNTPTLKGLLAELPVEIIDYGILPDDFEQTKAMLSQMASECDVVVSSAGVSVGEHDYLIQAIEAIGKINHYKIAMKPGKPLVFGSLSKSKPKLNEGDHSDSGDNINSQALYFGLPGNPLSTFVGGMLIVKPALWQLAKANQPPKPARIQATLTQDISKRAGRRDFQRGVISQDESGLWTVALAGKQDSHRIKQLSGANCLIDLPEDSGDVASGEQVWVLPFGWMI